MTRRRGPRRKSSTAQYGKDVDRNARPPMSARIAAAPRPDDGGTVKMWKLADPALDDADTEQTPADALPDWFQPAR